MSNMTIVSESPYVFKRDILDGKSIESKALTTNPIIEFTDRRIQSAQDVIEGIAKFTLSVSLFGVFTAVSIVSIGIYAENSIFFLSGLAVGVISGWGMIEITHDMDKAIVETTQVAMKAIVTNRQRFLR